MSNTNVSLLSLQGLQVYDPLIKAWAQAQDSVIVNNIADTFSASKTYDIGDLVIYNNVLYSFTKWHMAGAWDANDVIAVQIGELLKLINLSLGTAESDIDDLEDRADDIVKNFAPKFNTRTAYAADDYVIYQDVLYKFNAAHAAGAWVGTDADAIKVVDIVAGSGGDPDSFTQAQMTALLALLD